MKLTLLELTQDIANDLETDEINSINDTVESQQIAQIIKTTFYGMIGNRNWTHLKRTFQFENTNDVGKPTHLKSPLLLKELLFLNYNCRKEQDTKDKYRELTWYEPEEFFLHTNNRSSDSENILTITDFGGSKILIRNDKAPEFYTSFDDEYIVLDSYQVEIEDTVQGHKTQAVGYLEPAWSHIDGFIPDLPSEAFPALLAEAKSTAFVVLKQQANEKAEQTAQRQSRWLARKDWTIKGGVRYPNYGRKRHAGTSIKNPLLDKS